MQSALYAGPVVLAERPHTVDDVFQVLGAHLPGSSNMLSSRKRALGLTAKVEDDLKELADILVLPQRLPYMARQPFDQSLQVNVNSQIHQLSFSSGAGSPARLRRSPLP